MNKILKQLIFLIILISILILPYFVFAETPIKHPLTALEKIGPLSGYQTADENSLASLVGTVITAILGLLGVIFLVLMIYSGFIWMTARGEEEKVKKSQEIMRAAVIGLLIVVAAYAITQFITAYIIKGSGALK